MNFTEIAKLLKLIGKLAELLDYSNASSGAQIALIEINYFSLNFFYHFMTNSDLMKIDDRVFFEDLNDKNKIEYLATKRKKNKR